MSISVVVGLGWGDEGKGRVIDYLTPRCQVVVRFNGGANAGHTVIVDGKTFRFHLLPSGMLYPEKTCVIAHGVVIDPLALREELETVKAASPHLARLLISDRCHLVLPYHKLIDRLEEESRGKSKLGTTGRGIGPVYADKVARKGLRVCDLMQSDILQEKLGFALEEKNRLITRVYGARPLDFQEILQSLLAEAEYLRPFVTDTLSYFQQALANRQDLLMEGAQGTLLDHEIGTYPFVTSTSPTAGMVSLGSGIGPRRIDHVIGVIKSYATRVGTGPFPTELRGETERTIRERGLEYGTTTGRPRRCGWFDLAMGRVAVFANSTDEVVLTKLDVLSGLPQIQICTGYKLDGREIQGIPALAENLDRVQPVYVTMPGWSTDISQARRKQDLPQEALDYVAFLERELGVPFSFVSVGPSREQIVEM